MANAMANQSAGPDGEYYQEYTTGVPVEDQCDANYGDFQGQQYLPEQDFQEQSNQNSFEEHSWEGQEHGETMTGGPVNENEAFETYAAFT
jgi:hypothetical protein